MSSTLNSASGRVQDAVRSAEPLSRVPPTSTPRTEAAPDADPISRSSATASATAGADSVVDTDAINVQERQDMMRPDAATTSGLASDADLPSRQPHPQVETKTGMTGPPESAASEISQALDAAVEARFATATKATAAAPADRASDSSGSSIAAEAPETARPAQATWDESGPWTFAEASDDKGGDFANASSDQVTNSLKRSSCGYSADAVVPSSSAVDYRSTHYVQCTFQSTAGCAAVLQWVTRVEFRGFSSEVPSDPRDHHRTCPFPRAACTHAMIEASLKGCLAGA